MSRRNELEQLTDSELALRAQVQPATLSSILALGVLLARFDDGGVHGGKVAGFIRRYSSASNAVPWVDEPEVWRFIKQQSLKGILRFDPARLGAKTGKPAKLTTFLHDCCWRRLGDELKRLVLEAAAGTAEYCATLPHPDLAVRARQAEAAEAFAQALDDVQALRVAAIEREPATVKAGDRNRDIVRRHLEDDATFVELAGEYELSPKQVGRVVQAMQARERRLAEREGRIGAVDRAVMALALRDTAALRTMAPAEAPRRKRGQSQADMDRRAALETLVDAERAKQEVLASAPRLDALAEDIDRLVGALDGERVRIPGGWCWRRAGLGPVKLKALRRPTEKALERARAALAAGARAPLRLDGLPEGRAEAILDADVMAQMARNRSAAAAWGGKGRDGAVAQGAEGKLFTKNAAVAARA